MEQQSPDIKQLITDISSKYGIDSQVKLLSIEDRFGLSNHYITVSFQYGEKEMVFVFDESDLIKHRCRQYEALLRRLIGMPGGDRGPMKNPGEEW
jgi:hypothetical protein